MGMFSGISADSTSKTTTITHNPTNNSDNGSISSSIYTGKKSTVVAPGGTYYRLGKGANLTIESTDHGAVQSANSALMAAINSQAGLAREATMGLNELAETKVTDGANLNTKTTQLGVVIFGILGAVLAVVWFLRR